MSSPAQCLANAENAKLSTGPKSAEGKAKVAKNGVRHGLFANYSNLAPEQSARIAELVDMLHEGFAQRCDTDERAIHEFALALWRHEHFSEMESSFFSAAVAEERKASEAAPDEDNNSLLGRALKRDAQGPNVFAKLMRYEARIARHLEEARAYYNRVVDFVRIQRNRANPIPPPKPETPPQSTPEIPRNAPCPCGSGIKYKRCCGVHAPAVLCTA